jgi:hypothetical protein
MALSSVPGLTGASTATRIGQNLQSPADSDDDIIQQFEAYIKESPAARMEDDWLRAHGITKEQFDHMSADQKQKITDEMKQDIERKLKEKMQDAATAAVTLPL